jgi:hypothetical protein
MLGYPKLLIVIGLGIAILALLALFNGLLGAFEGSLFVFLGVVLLIRGLVAKVPDKEHRNG